MNINSFKAALATPARINQFRVELSFPGYVGNGALAAQKSQFLVSASEMPGSSIPPIPVAYRGRTVNYPGDRNFFPWNITILNDTDFAIRSAFEEWLNGIDNHTTGNGILTPLLVQTDMTIYQLDKNDTVLKEYRLINAMPVDVAPIGVNHAASDTISESNVSIVYDYWVSDTTS
jgi:hypothetical protein